MKKRNIIILTSIVLVQCLYSMDTYRPYSQWSSSMALKQTGYIINPLSDIEKLLVAGVIQQKGKACVIDMIKRKQNNAGQPILQFKCVFHLDQMTQCSLTRNVFAAIKAVEEKSWYCTRTKPHYRDSCLIALQAPTNYLGDSTRYTWNARYLKTRNTKTRTDQSSVVVKACFREERKDLLLDFVNKYDVGCGIK